jgi:hypothetical protein
VCVLVVHSNRTDTQTENHRKEEEEGQGCACMLNLEEKKVCSDHLVSILFLLLLYDILNTLLLYTVLCILHCILTIYSGQEKYTNDSICSMSLSMSIYLHHMLPTDTLGSVKENTTEKEEGEEKEGGK